MNKKIIIGLILLLVLPVVYAQECVINPQEMEQVLKSMIEKNNNQQLERINSRIDATMKGFENEFIAFASDELFEFRKMIKDILLMFMLTICGINLMILGIFSWLRTKKETNLLLAIREEFRKTKEVEGGDYTKP